MLIKYLVEGREDAEGGRVDGDKALERWKVYSTPQIPTSGHLQAVDTCSSEANTPNAPAAR